MNILVLATVFMYGGLETHICSYINVLKENNFYLGSTFVYKDTSDYKSFNNIIIYDPSNKDYIKSISKFINDNKIDIIHSHTSCTIELAYELSIINKIPFVVTVTNSL